MITNITVRNEATFNESGCSLNDLKAINIIYGANGSGKTTISRVLSSPNNHPISSIQWDSEEHLPILVYNRDFCESNFRELNDINGVYTLGEDNVEKQALLIDRQKELRENKENLQKKNNSINSINTSIKQHEETFLNFCWTSIFQSQIYSKFSHLFDGGRNSKKKISEMVLVNFYKGRTTSRSLEVLSDLYYSLFDKEQSSKSLISFTPQLTSDIELDSIWAIPIVGKSEVALANLISKYNISDWVQTGHKLLHYNSLNVCPFCQQQIPSTIISQLDELFDARYNEQVNRITILHRDYSQIVDKFKSLANSIINIDGIETFLNTSLFKESCNTLVNVFEKNLRDMEIKMKEPSRIIQLIDCSEHIVLLENLINEANQKIETYNNAIKNIKSEREQVLEELWAIIIQEHYSVIESYTSTTNKLKKRKMQFETEVKDVTNTISSLETEIRNLNKSMTDIQTTIDKINQILRFYNLSNFHLVRKDKDKYTIKRNTGEEVNNTLSEGEKTFVTFLYFMQLIKGGITAESTNEDKIVVIDDPVSSLDSNILYIVSSLIKDLLDDIRHNKSVVKQIIILTHNVFFHHDVSHGSTSAKEKYSFWILNKMDSLSYVTFYGSENPIKSSYHLLWHELKSIEEQKKDCGSAQNIMRRIYEHYFKFIGFYSNDNDIINSFTSESERKICRALICYINDGSHIIPDDLYYIPNNISLQAYLRVFKAIFEKTGHLGHYEMMWENS